jgi:aryl-alcohol dehydrogenase-like predicted oxidoreductase
MKVINLGRVNLKVLALGLGCMGMSWAYSPTEGEAEMISLLGKAVEPWGDAL